MISFIKSVLSVLFIFVALTSAAVVTLGPASDGSNSETIYTFKADGSVASQVPIKYSSSNSAFLTFAANPAKNLFYVLDPWNNNCFDCVFSFDLATGGAVLNQVPLNLPMQCMESIVVDYDPKQDQWFFGCQLSFIIKKGNSIQQFPLSFSPTYVSYDSYTNTLYTTGSGYVNQYNIASNTSTTYKVPLSDQIKLSNVVGTPSGQAFIAGHFFNSNQQTYELKWFTIGTNQKNWLIPVKNTSIKQHQVLGKAAYDADSHSIVWIDDAYLFKYDLVSAQITAHQATYKNQFLTWISAFGVVPLNN